MRKQLKGVIKQAFEPPESTRKSIFLRKLPYPRTTLVEAMISQIGYIRKRIWSVGLLVVCMILFYASLVPQDYEKIMLMTTGLPVLLLLVVSEVGKSRVYGMQELEMSCKYNLQKVVLLRLSVIGSFYFILFIMLGAAVGSQSSYGIARTMLYSGTPFLVVAYATLWIANHLQIRDTLYMSAGIACGVIFVGYIFRMHGSVLYRSRWVVGCSVLCIVLLILLWKEMKRWIEGMEDVQCHLI